LLLRASFIQSQSMLARVNTLLRPVHRYSSVSLPLQRRAFSVKTLYTKEHEWVRVENDIGVVGITDHAQKALGDIVFVDLPAVNKKVKKSDSFCTVESVKAASDVYAPVSGDVLEVNTKVTDTPGLVNQKAETDGWLCKLKLSNPTEVSALLNAEQYKKHCEEDKH